MLSLGGCDQSGTVQPTTSAPRATAAQTINDAAIADAIQSMLRARVFYSFGSSSHCGDEFLVGGPSITAHHLEGDHGQVEAVILITSMRALPERSDPTDGCFGAPAGGFATHQTMEIRRTYKVERWDTGWRLASDER